MNLAWKPTIPSHLSVKVKPRKPKHELAMRSDGNIDWSDKKNVSYLADAVRDGLTHEQIAKKLGCTTYQVTWGCKRNNITANKGRRPNKVFTRRQWDLIINLRAAGMPYTEIAKYVKTTKSVLANQIHNNESVQKIIEQKRKDFIDQVITLNKRKYQDESSI